MREYSEYQQILELWELGMAKQHMAFRLDIPRTTVQDCISRYGNLNGLEENRARASRSVPGEVLNRIKNADNVQTQEAYAYLLGMYLGDGNITKVRNVYRIRITLDTRYPGIIQTCSENLQTLLPQNQVGSLERYYRGRLSCVDVSCFYKFWPDVFPQHGTGVKHAREIRLEDW